MKLLLSLICAFGLYQTASAITIYSAYKSNLCLDVNRGDPNNWRWETNLEAWPCNSKDNQQFSLQPVSLEGISAIFTIQALGKCADVDLGFMESWTHQNNVQLYSCNGGTNQQFKVEPRNDGWFIIRSMYDGRCLDIDLNKANGWRFEHNVQLWSCTGESNQLWKFDSASSGTDIIEL